MKTFTYFLFIHPDKNGNFWGEFPDLPGCLTEASTEKELVLRAGKLLESWLTMLLDEGKALPIPQSKEIALAAAKSCSDAVSGVQPIRCSVTIVARHSCHNLQLA